MRILRVVINTLAIGLALFVTPLPAQGTADAQAAAVEREASRIFNSIMSPFCPGLLLANCPSGQAEQLRDEMRAKLGDGVDPDVIVADFYDTYGDEHRAVPEAKGFGLLAWVIPGAFLVVGLGWVAVWTRRNAWRAPVGPDDEDEVPIDEEDLAKVEAELSRS